MSGALPPVLRACEAIGRVVQFWGFSRHLGRVWTLLFLAEGPQPVARIQDELAISAGAASGYLKELLRWGVVRKVWIPGERKDYFAAETDLWKMVSRVIAEREGKLLEETRAALGDVEKDLKKRKKKAKSSKGKSARETGNRAAFQEQRVAELRRMAELAELLLSSLIANQKLDVRPLDTDLAAG